MPRRGGRLSLCAILLTCLGLACAGSLDAAEPVKRPYRPEALQRLRSLPAQDRMATRPMVMTMGEAAAAAGSEPAAAEVFAVEEDLAEPEAAVAAVAPPDPQRRLLAGHLWRRIGFGGTPAQIDKTARSSSLTGTINQQLSRLAPAGSRLPARPRNIYDDWAYMRRWYVRMVTSPNQLLEKMTLIWHEHFATSNEKVGVGLLMEKHEILLRKYALRRFPDMLKGITKDQAMLIWLDNDGNYAANCRDSDAALPNANYARELLQLFSTGPVQLNMDGTPVTDVNGVPLPAYTEQDVKEVALALSGWRVDWHRERFRAAFFDPEWHCTREKTVLGVTIPEREGKLGAKDVDDVVAIIMQQPSTAPFISKTLIQKLATEAPTPGYVQRVATVFAASRGDIRLTVRAILLDPEFTSEAVVRSQYKEPIEQLVGPIRALGGSTGGDALIQWSYLARQLIYYPPSVFSFYPPGHKDALVNTALLNFRDRAADEFATSWWDTGFDADKLLRTKKLTTPELAADYLASTLLAAPATPELRSELIAYMNTDEGLSGRKFRGAVWLVLCSPDFQRN